jgi:hypothetical protein
MSRSSGYLESRREPPRYATRKKKETVLSNTPERSKNAKREQRKTPGKKPKRIKTENKHSGPRDKNRDDNNRGYNDVGIRIRKTRKPKKKPKKEPKPKPKPKKIRMRHARLFGSFARTAKRNKKKKPHHRAELKYFLVSK